MTTNIVRFKKLRDAREKAGLSLNELAQKCKVKAETLLDFETGVRDSEVYLDDLSRVSKSLGLRLVETVKI